MISVLVITEQVGDGISAPVTGVAALDYDFECTDLVERQTHILGVTPSNLTVLAGVATAQTVAEMRQDARIYVIEPGPGYSATALANFLDARGAGGAGVESGDTEQAATSKVIEHLRWHAQ